MSNITTQAVKHVAALAHIPITDSEATNLQTAFSETLDEVNKLTSIDVTKTSPTHHTTGLENIWRDDVVNETRTFSQTQALSNAKKTHDGYFVVPRLIGGSE